MASVGVTALSVVATACASQPNPVTPTTTIVAAPNLVNGVEFTGRICTSFLIPCAADYPREVHHELALKRATRASVIVSWHYSGDYSPDQMILQISCGGTVAVRQALQLYAGGYDLLRDATPAVSLDLPVCAYDVALSRFTDNSKAYPGLWTAYTIRINPQ
jgi:hypothetical protein